MSEESQEFDKQIRRRNHENRLERKERFEDEIENDDES
jgi:hypothetical protein